MWDLKAHCTMSEFNERRVSLLAWGQLWISFVKDNGIEKKKIGGMDDFEISTGQNFGISRRICKKKTISL